MEMPSTPRLYMLCGPSLGGKSTICKRLVDVLDAARISADEINAERNLPFGGEGLPESIWAETLAKAFGSLRMADTRRSRRRNRFICRTRCLDYERGGCREGNKPIETEPGNRKASSSDGCMLMHGIEIQTAARFGVKVIFLDTNNGEKIRTRKPILADTVYGRTLKAVQLVLQGMWSREPCPRCRR